ncbi:hypothetical protein QFZ77_002708 [Paenibacillus sp. V4I3]|nr:hypothetical protein [Paenibacillus sp. V4I3]MDQ0890076.1 hypothetical protein [Paenibacillus sp. V4I9]
MSSEKLILDGKLVAKSSACKRLGIDSRRIAILDYYQIPIEGSTR